MSALPEETITMSEAEYLAYERASEIKHEYLDGDVFAMTGASEQHNVICTNLSRIIGNQILEGPCKIYQSDMRVKVEATRLYTYPDITVVCDTPKLADKEFDTLLNPTVIIEVLSPSTERYDRGRKFQDYRRLASLKEYVLVSQDSAQIERYLRQDNGEWVLTDVVGLDSKFELPSVGCSLDMADVYRKVTFETETDE
jgi:Uma2 family endonuclease